MTSLGALGLESLAIGMGADCAHLYRCELFGDPVAKGRPRVTRTGRAYTPRKTAQAERDLAWLLRAARPDDHALAGPVVVVARFWRQTRRRGDVDNYAKLLLDAGTKAGLWGDDSQIVATITLLEHDPDRPRTEVVWGPRVA